MGAGRWHARWVAAAPPPLQFHGVTPSLDGRAAMGVTLFRRRLELEAAPTRAVLRITADSRYVLWVDGRELGRGPVRGNPRRLRHDDYDLRDVLRRGPNVLAVLVRHYGVPNPWWMPVPATYGLGGSALAAELDLGDAGAVGTDARWRCLRSGAWLAAAPGGFSAPHAPEIVDARLLPPGWQEPGFDDEGWDAAVELTPHHIGYGGDPRPPVHPYGPLPPRPLPQLGGPVREGRVVALGAAPHEATEDDPVLQAAADQAAAGALVSTAVELPAVLEQPATDSARVVIVDLGEETAGLLGLELDAPAGTRLDGRGAEDVTDEGGVEPLQQHSGFRYLARGHDDVFETIDPMGLRYLQLSIRGDGPVTLRRVSVRERSRPRPEGPFFASSDPELDRIWQTGVRTVDLCAQDAYLDCPSREQRAWTGDAVVHQMVDLVANPDWSLARWNVELAASPRPDGMLPMAVGGDAEWSDETFIPDWALHWVHSLHNLHRHDRDVERIARLLPVAERVVDWFRPFVDDRGLLTDVTGWLLVDWSAVTTAGTSGAVTALWARALAEVADMASHLGDEGRATRARLAHERVRAGFEALWDEERGVYVDHLLDGVPGRTVSQHTNSSAVVAGVVPDDRVVALVERITDPRALAQASWLMPGREATVEGPGDMYADVSYLAAGPAAPWWDVEHRIVAAQPFFRYVVHDAVAVAGLDERIPELCRDWARLLDDDTTTWREVWFGGSHCHGWSSTPTRDLSTRTLGVRPAAPGFASVEIAPALGDLDHARGAVVTPDGLVEVDVGTGHLHVDTPLPAIVRWKGRTEELPPGRHRIEPS